MAPKIYLSTLEIVERINYPVDLIEVTRWVEGDNQLLLVNKLESEKKKIKIKPVSGLQIYDDEFYKKEYNKESAKYFLNYVKEVEKLIKDKGWNLETKFNKIYCGFKAGFFNAFAIKWYGSKTFGFFFKLSENEALNTNIPMTKYDTQWKEAVYYIDPKKTKVHDFLPLFEMSYKKLSGE